MMLAIFLVQLQLIFKLFLLNRVLRACVLGKCFLIKRRNVPPTFVCTLSLYGGLNQVMLLALFLVFALWFHRGMTEYTFKSRYNNHKMSFNYRKYAHDTVLSKYVWDLKDNNVKHSIKWSILKRSTPYKGGRTRCNLCLAEKLSILTAKKSSLLNRRSELITKYQHVNKFLAANHKQQRLP